MASVWVKIVSSWLCVALYGWTLVAPALFPDREFYDGFPVLLSKIVPALSPVVFHPVTEFGLLTNNGYLKDGQICRPGESGALPSTNGIPLWTGSVLHGLVPSVRVVGLYKQKVKFVDSGNSFSSDLKSS
ncbi:hypothetical protein OESDEN_25286, partial [Oesophagostomum dentatum]